MTKENRHFNLHFAVTGQERDRIEAKKEAAGVHNLSAFLRAMVLNGYVLKLNFPEIREMIRLLGIMTNNINQIAKRENAGGHIYETELYEIQENQQELGNILRQILTKLDGFN